MATKVVTPVATPAAPTVAQLQAQLAQLQAQNAALLSQVTGGQGSRSTMAWQGHSCTALIRAMAHANYGAGQINRVLVALGLVVSPATISTQRQLAKGNAKKAIAGKPGATLTPAQWGHLQACLAAAAPPAFAPATATPGQGS